ncbi:hypothetical protein CLPUN_17220 [Clostridium puniceum]|uniref:DUF1659 domain-containing protein n=1 Tax=Clostridium puniceum TaxID=29367 RepID=A0A1S8TNJ7_9CLOT|nr:DUF1659 domain-containing protein [Clostridium puniceum]OOM78995.1 hypothetical protein CLPUN_17220 [Clostridium puniceum]
MAINNVVTDTSLNIEVQKGIDKSGDPIYSKKTFSNLRNDVDSQSAYDVADAIKGVLEANSRNVSLTVASDLIKA